jgi:hypothetical protein
VPAQSVCQLLFHALCNVKLAACAYYFSRLQLTCEPPTCRLQEVIVIDATAARDATEEILRLHSIPAVVSKDLQDLLEKPPQPAMPPQDKMQPEQPAQQAGETAAEATGQPADAEQQPAAAGTAAA